MELTYRFNPKIQLAYSVMGFLASLLLLFLILGRLEWIAAFVIGIGNFLVAGFYPEYKNCK